MIYFDINKGPRGKIKMAIDYDNQLVRNTSLETLYWKRGFVQNIQNPDNLKQDGNQFT